MTFFTDMSRLSGSIPSYGYSGPKVSVSTASPIVANQKIAKAENNVHAETKKLFVKKQSSAPVVTDKSNRLISEFTKPKEVAQKKTETLAQTSTVSARRIDDAAAANLKDGDIEYARSCERRLVERAVKNACGNSPFCINEKHRHEDDHTAFGQRENAVRRSVWLKQQRFPASKKSAMMLPDYPFDKKYDRFSSDQEMSAEDFAAGLKRGDVEYLVLAHFRIYYAEHANIIQTVTRNYNEVDAERRRKQREAATAAAAVSSSAELDSINEFYNSKRLSFAGDATNRMRVLEIVTMQKLKSLLKTLNVPRINVVLAALMQLVLSDRYKDEPELDVLDAIKTTLLGREHDTVSYDAAQTFNSPHMERRQPQKVLAIDDVTQASKKRKLDEPSRRSAPQWSEVCPSQFDFADKCNACSSICLNVAATLCQSSRDSISMRMEEPLFIERLLEWEALVRNGVDHWLERENKQYAHQHVMELLAAGNRATTIKEKFAYFEFTGSLFADKPSEQDAVDAEMQRTHPDLHTALELCDVEVGKRRPFACIVTFHGHSICVSCHAHGWYVFDSAGGGVSSKSVLFACEAVEDVVALVKKIFKTKEHDERLPAAGITLDEHVSYSLFCLVLKQ